MVQVHIPGISIHNFQQSFQILRRIRYENGGKSFICLRACCIYVGAVRCDIEHVFKYRRLHGKNRFVHAKQGHTLLSLARCCEYNVSVRKPKCRMLLPGYRAESRGTCAHRNCIRCAHSLTMYASILLAPPMCRPRMGGIGTRNGLSECNYGYLDEEEPISH